MRLLVTGGAGFIGSAFIRLALREDWASRLVNLDKLTYAGNLENIASVEADPRYRFVHGDILDAPLLGSLFGEEKFDAVVHFAAESHVDRSILGPAAFVETNVRGTFQLLEAARAARTARFLLVSTDEVYGSIPEPHDADETDPLNPSSPYSASKAGADLLALSYFTTFGTPVLVTRASNNYGPFQFPEKLIPLMISNALEDRPLPIYGDGLQVRDWLHADDHCRALNAVLLHGSPGEIYNVGGSRALPNREVVELILDTLGKPRSLMTPVTDRPGHDRRYAITTEKLQKSTGWQAQIPFEQGLRDTINWYRANTEWTARVKSGEYRSYYERNYSER
ncbi:MAG TPA: dTDP-glucose 4,6-dehydratase [Bryobacteraceae bacterium]|nr:dTDP-glucose 4,6-dehydratase [Bryobacterales bacterium]HRJ17667.1 dTDP-glucose 4,6-dehydratase [Bryobacteraceae bacterium]